MGKLVEYLKGKRPAIVAGLIGAAAMAFLGTAVVGGEKFLSSNTFCLSCHSMSYNAKELKESSHFGATGINPECQDCHLPPQFLKRVESHVVDGVRALVGEMTHDLSTKEQFDKYRAEYAHNARLNIKKWDSASCRSCHKGPRPSSDEAAAQHKRMKTEGKTCIDCHQNREHERVPEQDLDKSLALGRIVLLESAQPKAPGIESREYVWHKPNEEEAKVLALAGDKQRGATLYDSCRGCHRANGAGRPDGAYPRLAGQHATALIKQMLDIQAGVRDNPKMFRSIHDREFGAPQEMADLAAYLEALPAPADNGQGPGRALERGRELYERDCKGCHGASGEGDKAKFYPAVAGQHHGYMVRQISRTETGKRRNANPDMVAAVREYAAEDIEAVADYMSRLQTPERSARR